MFTSISINNFRCFDELSINSLERVNLIAGKNNVGKTALLEAIFLLADGPNILRVVAIGNFRGIHKINKTAGSELLFSPLFANFNNESIVKISGELNTGERHIVEIQVVSGTSASLSISDETPQKIEELTKDRLGQVLQLQYTSPPGESYLSRMWIEEQNIRVEMNAFNSHFTVYYLSSNARQTSEDDAEKLGRLEVEKESYDLLESLRIVEPSLKRLATIVVAGMPIIYGDIGLNRMLPLSVMGEGIRRLTSILLAIANAPHGIVLVDEIENGLHHSILNKVWQAVGDAARRFDTQVIATTHSYECIQAAHQAFSNSDNYDFRLHRLDRVADKIRVVTYDEETLAAALQAELEVR